MHTSPAHARPDYDPSKLLDALIDVLKLKNDAALSRVLEVGPPVISRIRHRKMPLGGILLLRMHDVSGLSVKKLRSIMGDRRDKIRPIRTIYEPGMSSHLRH